VCCEGTEVLDLPAEVIEAQARYRRLLDERGWDWGDEQLPDFFRWARFTLLGPVFEAVGETGDWASAIRSVIGDEVPAGVVVIGVDEGRSLRIRTGPARPVLAGRPVGIDVVVDSAAPTALSLTVAGREVAVAAGGAAIETVDVDHTFEVALDGSTVQVDGAVRRIAAARLRLSAPDCARWSVTDAAGGAWFPDDIPAKWDVHHRPFFHGRDVTLAVPAGPLHVVCARGLEFGRVEVDVSPAPGDTAHVPADPQRLFDPAADGWYGGDLHVHLNYSGDLVCTLADAARMQRGEGLHLLNLVAGNLSTSTVYDRELLEQTAGTDLPWSGGDTVARAGVEYRNDLLGHVHGLGPSAPPTRYYAGHERSDAPEDWPPNAVACAELRSLGATVGYPHPAFSPFPDGSTEQFFGNPRSVEARELVADAALGLVDSVDVISPFDDEGAIFLYHRLLSCGLRLSATAGTDTFLSFAHGPGVASNPPGWGRVYAHLGGKSLSVPAFQEAVRAGATVVTNGPWLTFEVNGRGPGAVLDGVAGDLLAVRARAYGPGAERLTLVGPDGVLAEGGPDRVLEHTLTVGEPLWLAAAVRGAGQPSILADAALAHTSPVYVDVDGRRVARSEDAEWCLRFLDTLQGFVAEHGRFSPVTREAHLGDLVEVLDRARSFYRGVVAAAADHGR
jgi:hypothetical protein